MDTTILGSGPRPLLGSTFRERCGRFLVIVGLAVGVGSAVAAANWLSISRGHARSGGDVTVMAVEASLQAQQWALWCLVALLTAVAGLAVLAWEGRRLVDR